MREVTRKIGLSLGADICWPLCYEAILKELRLAMPINEELVRINFERITVEPFNLRQECSYDVVLDRLTHWFHMSREWIKKAVIMDGLYVLNNPWAIQSMEKHTTYCAMMKLGLPIPDTILVPPKEPTSHADVRPTLHKYARLFNLKGIGDEMGYPLFIKPYDGGGWRGVSQIKNGDELRAAYEQSGQSVMHLQKSVGAYDLFVRAVGIGPQVDPIRYDPAAPLHGRYVVEKNFLSAEEKKLMEDMTLTINGFFGWDFNSCEALRQNGEFIPIDFANACPDFQVTSLHYHFPEMVKRMVKWSIFCAATKKPMQPNLDWTPFFDVQKQELPLRERLAAYADITRKRMQADAFEEFCIQHLPHLDEVVWDFFGSYEAKTAVRSKVAALYPDHEIETFTDHFWGLIQQWRQDFEVSPPVLEGHEERDLNSEVER